MTLGAALGIINIATLEAKQAEGLEAAVGISLVAVGI